MASLTIIPYTPKPANSYRNNSCYYAKDVFKRISSHDKESRIKPGVLLVDTPQPQATAAAGEAGILATHEKDSNSISNGDRLSSERQGNHGSACISQAQDQACSEQYRNKGASISIGEAAGSRMVTLFAETNDVGDQTYSQQHQDKGASISIGGPEEVGGVGDCDIEIEIDSLFDEIGDIAGCQNDSILSKTNGTFADTESKADDIESEMRDIKNSDHSLKRKARTRRQGSQRSPLVIPDSDTESGSDSESEDELAWKKRNVGHSLVGRQGERVVAINGNERPWLRVIDETDDEVDDIKFDVGGTKVRAGNDLSENNGVAGEVRDSEDSGQSRPSPAASSAQHSDVDSTLFKPTDLVKPQSVARVGGDGEWGIHGIIGKEVIGGEIYFCVDWEPTMMPERELGQAQRLVQEFEAKEQARRRKKGDAQKRKHQSRHRKQK
ncbi:hypothetical protein GP486_004017 [Trichoglossum hirsutum]|uniref:Uncharacterized protein n=1 Tax=Trichoglossum hirsutum TaxID=265104 RepID=A0A9P8RQC9_9PEZI|nr:hypothetical protein GP486_004017 [Trichoglossum hirsutum]